MNLRELQAFIRLSETLHFSQAAESIHVSASTLSRMMMRLEEEFDQVFFERDNRSVRMTPEGERFEQFARNVVEQWTSLKQDFDRENERLSGELTIYCTITAAHLYLTKLLDIYRRLYPDVEIRLETGDVAAAYTKVNDQSVDIAFAVAPESLAKKFEFQSIESIPLEVIAPKVSSHFSTELKPGAINWQKLPFVMPESGPAKSHTLEWLAKMNVKPNVYAQVTGHEAIVSLTALGCGISVVPLPVLEHSPVKDKIKVLSVPFKPTPFDFGIVCLRKRRSSPLINAFWELVYQGFEV